MLGPARPKSLMGGWMVQSRLACFARVSIPLLLAAAGGGISASAASADDVIRFGAPLPITGPMAPEAVKQRQGYDLWAEQANKTGGITVGGKKYKVEIVYADYQSNTPRAVQTTEQMITQDNVNFLFGAFGSDPSHGGKATPVPSGLQSSWDDRPASSSR